MEYYVRNQLEDTQEERQQFVVYHNKKN